MKASRVVSSQGRCKTGWSRHSTISNSISTANNRPVTAPGTVGRNFPCGSTGPQHRNYDTWPVPSGSEEGFKIACSRLSIRPCTGSLRSSSQSSYYTASPWTWDVGTRPQARTVRKSWSAPSRTRLQTILEHNWPPSLTSLSLLPLTHTSFHFCSPHSLPCSPILPAGPAFGRRRLGHAAGRCTFGLSTDFSKPALGAFPTGF